MNTLENDQNQIGKPLVCVRSITFNHAPYIADAMNGFCMQKTSFPFVCAVIDDCSTDGEQEVISNYLHEHFDLEDQSVVRNEETDDYKLVYARHKENHNCFFVVLYLKYNHYSIGKSHLKNQYIKEWYDSAKYIALCEGDDYWIDPLKLQKQVDVLELHTECTICYGRVTTIDRNGYPKDRVFPNRNVPFIFSLKDFITMEFLEGSWVFQTSSFLYRRDIMVDYSDALRTRFKNFPHGDLIIQLFCLEKGKGYYISDTVSCYRMDSGGYNSYAESHPEFAIKQYEKKVNGLKDYDKATNYIFHYELQIGILGIELANEKRKNSRFGFFRKKYLILYKEKGIKGTLIMLMSYYTPTLLKYLVNLKKKINGEN